ncbi:MAG: HD domain-containing phosphohydrolase [Desulfobacterales bacterium]|nr:HD domain-containing phosphohydrolase [Desulfobacterales bacterium]
MMLNPFPQRIDMPSSDETPTGADDHARLKAVAQPHDEEESPPQSMNDVPLYNSRIIDNYIKLIKFKYPWINATGILNYAGMTSYEVADQGHWFTQRQINRFHEKLAACTQNVNISREAGRYSASPDAIGVMRQYGLGMIGPDKCFEHMGTFASKFTKSSAFHSKRLSPNKYEIAVHPRPGVREKQFQCENRIGFLESVTLAFSNKLPHIEHPECIFRGDAACRYLISWESSFSLVWKRIRAYMPVLFVLSCILLHMGAPQIRLTTLLLSSAVLFLLLTLIGESMEKNELRKSVDNLKDSTDKLVDQIALNYNNSLMINEVGQLIAGKTKVDDVLDKVVKISQRRLNFDRGIILLANKAKTRLEYRAAYGYSQEMRNMVRTASFHLDKPGSRGFFVVSFREQKPYLINDFNEIERELSPRSLDFARKMGAKAFICSPIVCEGEALGVFAVDNIHSRRPLVQSDLSLLIGVASIIGIAIRNTKLIESKERQFSSILEVLAASIDARDPLTSGHSAKVTEYAVGICKELKMDSQYCEMIRVAALLHDYGKIGVPDSILNKAGRLTGKEYETVKTHAASTRAILERVNFEGVYKEVPIIAGAHHERYDGRGYPEGLAGEEIPMGARIIAVADFFEAVTAKRHYHQPMAPEQAFALMQAKINTHFDPRVVEAFMRYHKVNPDLVLMKTPAALA